MADAFGAHVAPGPLLPCNVVAATLARSGTDEHQSEIVPAIIAGDVVATWASTEPPPHDRLGDIALRAETDGDEFVLTGVKSPVEAGAEADQLLVTATTDAGLTQFLLASDAPGVTVTPLRSVDLVRRFARIQFDGVRLPASAVVGEVGERRRRRRAPAADRRRGAERGDGRRRAGRVRLHARLGVQPLLVRPSARVVPGDQAPLRRHEDVARGESRAGRRRGAPRGSATSAAALATSAAKAYTGDYLAELAQDCVQMHGGIGVTYEHDIHLFLRRITVDRLTYGTPTDHRQRIAALRARTPPDRRTTRHCT